MRWTQTSRVQRKALPFICMLVAMLPTCNRVEPPRPGEQRSGLFLVRQNGRLGYVNSRGQVKIAPQFDQAGPFSDGLAPVSVGGRAGYIDTEGKIAVAP